MKIIINKEKFSDMEDAFTRLKANENDVSALRKLSDSLHALTGKTIKVSVVKPESKNQSCVVMSVYPEESTIDKIINAITSESNDSVITSIWNDNVSWNVEIDSRILTSDANLTEKELVALLMHEIGHIVYSNSVPMRISKIVRFEFAKSNFVTRQLLKDNIFSKILCFPILNACNFRTNKTDLNAEIQADKYSIQSGYGEYLKSAIDKIFIFAGSDTTMNDDMKELMGFSIDSLVLLQKRQNKIARRNIQKMIASTPSTFAKNVVGKLYNSLSAVTSPNGSVTEEAKDEFINSKIDSITNDFYMSEAFFNKVHKLKRLDPADFDYIALELNNIKSNDDKMMIVSYIYNKIDTIDYYIALIDSKNPKYVIPHSKESLIQMRERLDKYRIAAINKKLPEINYGITIQYPSGYEG